MAAIAIFIAPPLPRGAAAAERGAGSSLRRRPGRVVGEPHLLDVVEGPDVRPEDVDDHVAGIDQHPVERAHAFDAEIADAGVLQVAEQPVGDGADMAVRPAGSDDHEVAERRFSGDVDGNRVLGLGVVETAEDHFQGVRRCKVTASGR